MRVLLTGCTGFVGKFVLRDLLLRFKDSTGEEGQTNTVLCLMRGKKGQTAQQRWSEFQTDSLFTGLDFSNARLLEGDLSSLASLALEDLKPDALLHSAANVKTLDPYPELYEDNVVGVQNICDLCVKWRIPRLHLVSTCYVHSRGCVGKPELLAPNLPRSLFTTDYTYTKYLGECAANSYADRLKISILRLSCVGAPSNWLDAHPTPGAMAHLGILSLILRGKLVVMCVPSTTILSTVPVNVVSRCVVDDVLAQTVETAVATTVKQICAGPASQWNISISRLSSTLQRISPNAAHMQLLNLGESEFKAELNRQWGFSCYTPWGYKSLKFHEEVNDFISKFADGQRFESSIPDAYFPQMPDERIYEQSCLYVARGIHQYAMEKGVFKSNLDLFWGSMPEHHIQGEISFKKPLVFASKEEAIRRFYDCFAAYRPFFADPDSNKLSYSGRRGPTIRWSTGKDASKDTQQGGHIELLGDPTSVTGFKMTGHHGIGDGVAFLGLLPRVDSLHLPEPEQTLVTPSAKSRHLTFAQEIRCLFYYLIGLVIILFEKKLPHPRAEKTTKMARDALHRTEGKTFTTSLLEKTYPVLRSALQKDSIVYCIPAVTASPAQRGLQFPQNSFVPILLRWSGEESKLREMCLQSKAVKFATWCLCQIITYTGSSWLRDLLMDKVDAVVSSILVSETSLKNVDSFHVLSPVSNNIPFTVNAMTMGAETNLTVASSHKDLSAEDFMKRLMTK